jgi:hypothetical protein
MFYYSIKNKKALDIFKSYFSKTFKISKHKFLEIQLYSYDYYKFEFLLDISLLRKNHAGVELDVGLLGKNLNIHFFDRRHWIKE